MNCLFQLQQSARIARRAERELLTEGKILFNLLCQQYSSNISI